MAVVGSEELNFRQKSGEKKLSKFMMDASGEGNKGPPYIIN
jgi:hypothetical protein